MRELAPGVHVLGGTKGGIATINNIAGDGGIGQLVGGKGDNDVAS